MENNLAIAKPSWTYNPDEDIPLQKPTYDLSHLITYPSQLYPDKVAIDDGKVSFTFKEMANGAEGLAHTLRSLTCSAGDRVVVFTEKRSIIASIICGIWKAGCVYVPVDTGSPEGRTTKLFESITPSVIIAPDNYDIPEKCDVPVIRFKEIYQYHTTPHELFVPPEPDPERLAYIIHTSGSTGSPKGVMINVRSLIDYFFNQNQVFRFSETSAVISNAPFHFDVSIEDTLLPLSLGAFVYQFRGLPIPGRMLKVVESKSITHVIAVATILTAVTGDGTKLREYDLSSLEVIITGAEVCDVKVINIWKELGNLRVLNVYGPTEATIVCTAYEIKAADRGRKTFYPIGKPLPNVQVLLLNEEHSIVEEQGTEGELLIGGSQVMKGYWNDWESSARAFYFRDDVKYYRTGDICYYDEEGNLVFSGRKDDEVKISGKRINLTGIRQALMEHPGVKNAAVGTVFVQKQCRLMAIIDPVSDGITFSDLRSFAYDYLPEYMVPLYWAICNTPVLSSTGKQDHKKLLKMLGEAVAIHQQTFYSHLKQEGFIPVYTEK
jgi:amino acid adenylation domain-containing protein